METYEKSLVPCPYENHEKKIEIVTKSQ